MKASIAARLARLEGAGGVQPPDPDRMAVAKAAFMAVAAVGGYTGRGRGGSQAEAAARALGITVTEMRAWMRDGSGRFWPAMRAVLAAEAERRGVAVDALLMEAVA